MVAAQESNPSSPSAGHKELEGQVAVVTGGVGCIGSATASALASVGAGVACIDIEDPAPLAGQLRQAGCDAIGIQADLRDDEQVSRAFGSVVDHYGAIDVLVNMVGVYYEVPRVPFWEIDVDTWNTVVDSNLLAVFLSCRAAAPTMRAAKRGRIVNVSSNTAVFGMAYFMHYIAAKAGIVGMTRAMARELGPDGIAVNAVAPGLVRTERSVGAGGEEYLREVVAGQCLQSAIEVQDVVEAVMFLSGPRGRIVTGQTVLVNGGASVGPF